MRWTQIASVVCIQVARMTGSGFCSATGGHGRRLLPILAANLSDDDNDRRLTSVTRLLGKEPRREKVVHRVGVSWHCGDFILAVGRGIPTMFRRICGRRFAGRAKCSRKGITPARKMINCNPKRAPRSRGRRGPIAFASNVVCGSFLPA